MFQQKEAVDIGSNGGKSTIEAEAVVPGKDVESMDTWPVACKGEDGTKLESLSRNRLWELEPSSIETEKGREGEAPLASTSNEGALREDSLDRSSNDWPNGF